MDETTELFELFTKLIELFFDFVIKISEINKKSIWVNDLYLKRQLYGAYHYLMPNLISNQTLNFKKFIRVDLNTFNYLVTSLKSELYKKSPFRDCLSVEEKLFITLR